MNGRIKEKAEEQSKEASAKSLRFVKGIPRACHNPLYRAAFVPKRKDQRFCDPKCKEAFFKVKYALLSLAPYFNVEIKEGPEGNS